MRYAVVIAMVLWACDDRASSPPLDGSNQTVDAPAIDAPVSIDADTSAITAACMHVCDALNVCFGETPAGCYSDCGPDLADCTPQQVMDVDACKTAACGDENSSPIMDCIEAVGCVDVDMN